MNSFDQARYDAILRAVEALTPEATRQFEEAVMTGVGLANAYGVSFTKITTEGPVVYPGDSMFGVQPIKLISRQEAEEIYGK